MFFFLPLLTCYYIYRALLGLIACNGDMSMFRLKFSIPCIIAYVSFLFAGMVNLPTFFRHARSRYDSYIALTFITLIIALFSNSELMDQH